MKVRIAGLTAALALAFAAPASAHFLDKGPLGGAVDCGVSYNEAVYMTAAHQGGYHGGFLRAGNILAQNTYGGGCQDLKIGVRANDNALLYSWVRVRGGQYYLQMGHQ